ncbi:O-antigen ligase [Streptomyces sp. TverLS-915]|uniref:O-antigen ligase family protein n=1 Tax=Streptomyces sp. TverLS-915 TaxID=1839763 RepID=UPI00081DA51C|nr:O-antigen ligase [Streptomyces sp. TverLS-915]
MTHAATHATGQPAAHAAVPATEAAVPAAPPVAAREAARPAPLTVLARGLRRHVPARLLPALAVLALLAYPATPGAEGATPADAASAVLVLTVVLRLLREGRGSGGRDESGAGGERGGSAGETGGSRGTGGVRGATPFRAALTPRAALVLGAPVLALALAAFGAADAATGIAGLGRYLQIFVLVPAALLLSLRDARDVRVLAWGLVALALAEGGVGVVQYLTGSGASYMGEDVRAVGTFGPGDVMGMATVVAYGLVAASGLALARTGEAPRLQRPLAALCAAALLVPLALSFSRGAWIATAAVLGLQLLAAGPRRALAVLAAASAAAVVLVGSLGIGSAMLQERLSSITKVTDAPDQSVTDRYTLWAAAADMWREHPVSGVGLKNFPAHRDSHASLALSAGSDTAGAGQDFRVQPLLSPHNMYLLVLGEQGLIGLTALAGSWAALLVLGVRRLAGTHRRRAPRRRPLDCGLVACGLLVWQLVDFTYADIGGPATVMTALALGLAAWWGLGTRYGAERPGAEDDGSYGAEGDGSYGAGGSAAYEAPGRPVPYATPCPAPHRQPASQPSERRTP